MVSDYGQRCCENAGLSFIVEQALRILRILVARMRDIDFSAPLPLVRLVQRMPRRLLAGACCVFTLGAAHAACPPSAIASLEKPGTALRNGVDRGMLWRIERDGRTSWLYGTLHVGRGDWVRPGPTIQKALNQSDTLALELDSRDEATARAMSQPADPEVVARADGLYPEFGVDETLAVSARNSNKPIVALESAAEQIKVLTGGSESEEAEQVDAALDELESGKLRGQLKEMADVWARSDAARLARYAEWCDCVKTPAEQRLMKRLLDDRNPNLADGIERLHSGGKGVFAAVGAPPSTSAAPADRSCAARRPPRTRPCRRHAAARCRRPGSGCGRRAGAS
jgi:uncharacterized protein YbaP (TraB family)